MSAFEPEPEDTVGVRERILQLVRDDLYRGPSTHLQTIAGVRSLAPGLRDVAATATAKVLRRAGGEPIGIDVSRRPADRQPRTVSLHGQ